MGLTLQQMRLVTPIFGALALLGCSGASDDSQSALPPTGDGGRVFYLYPNLSQGDSVVNHLAKGVMASLQPGGTYRLSIQSASQSDPPDLHLYLATSVGDTAIQYSYLQTVSPAQASDGFYYLFDPDITAYSNVLTVLDSNGNYFSGEMTALDFVAVGQHPASFGVNLVVAGDVGKWRDDADSLAAALQTTLEEIYESRGIGIDTVRVVFAEDNPKVGSKYPANKQVVFYYASSDFSELSQQNDPEIRQNLDLILVHHFDLSGMMGISPLLGSHLTQGSGSVVVVSGYDNSSIIMSAVSSSEMANTAAHEIGHFLGLRHTTMTSLDQESLGDQSLSEDGFDDTPYCEGMESGDGLVGLARKGWSRIKIDAVASSDSYLRCPDLNNLMFPYAVPGVLPNQLSSLQVETIKRNLSLLPR